MFGGGSKATVTKSAMVLMSQQDVDHLLDEVVILLSAKAETLSRYSEAMIVIQEGVGDESLQGDYADAGHILMYQARKNTTFGKSKVHHHGRTEINWQRSNPVSMSGLQVFQKRVTEESEAWLALHPALTAVPAVEENRISSRFRGDSVKREAVLTQNQLVTQMIKSRVDKTCWDNMISTSSLLRSGVNKKYLISVIEGMRNCMANPDAEINADAADMNREQAEMRLKELELPIDVQINHYKMKALLETYIEDIRRTNSVWSDVQLMKHILAKLDNVTIFENIERHWSTEERFKNCDCLELFWKILEAEYNLFKTSVQGKEWLKTKSLDLNGGGTGMSTGTGMSAVVNFAHRNQSSFTSVVGGNRAEKRHVCFDHLKFLRRESGPCQYGNGCKYAHLDMSPSNHKSNSNSNSNASINSSSLSFEENARNTFDRLKRKREGGSASNNVVDRNTAQQLFNKFSRGDNDKNDKGQSRRNVSHYQPITPASVHFTETTGTDQQEFELFFTALVTEQSGNENNGDE